MARIRWNPPAEAQLLHSDTGPVGRRLRNTARRVEAQAQRGCPVDTGRLRESIHTEMGRDGRGMYADVGSSVDYAMAVELGSRAHIIESTGPWPLRNRRTGQVFGQRVRHPGTRAQPFLRPALDVIRGEA